MCFSSILRISADFAIAGPYREINQVTQRLFKVVVVVVVVGVVVALSSFHIKIIQNYYYESLTKI